MSVDPVKLARDQEAEEAAYVRDMLLRTPMGLAGAFAGAYVVSIATPMLDDSIFSRAVVVGAPGWLLAAGLSLIVGSVIWTLFGRRG